MPVEKQTVDICRRLSDIGFGSLRLSIPTAARLATGKSKLTTNGLLFLIDGSAIGLAGRIAIPDSVKGNRPMTSFHRQFGTEWTCLDDRADIGPHHLAIGKTRKLFEVGDAIEAFFSEGYRIGHARLDTETLALRETNSLSALPVAWGGGAFCIDADDSGRIVLVFVPRNRREFCAVRGTVSGSGIEWADWNPLLATRAPQAAPWVEMGPDGTAWSSVLARDGDFRLAIIEPSGRVQTGSLFGPNEKPWFPSCVQVLPVGAD